MTGPLGPPGNEERRPRTGGGAHDKTRTRSDASSITCRTDIAAELWQVLRDCPPEAIYWASLAYVLGKWEHADERARVLGEAGDDICAGGIPLLRQPTFRELTRRRGDHLPGSDRCGTCTRCRLSLRYWGHAERAGASS